MDSESIISILIFSAIFIFNLVRSIKEEKKKAEKRAKEVVVTTSEETHQNRQEMNRPRQTVTPHHDVSRPVADQRNHSEVERMEEALRRQREKYAEEERRRDEARKKAMDKEKQQMNSRKSSSKVTSSPFLTGEGDVSSIRHEEITPMAPVEDEQSYSSIQLNLEDEEEFKRAFVYSEILNRKY